MINYGGIIHEIDITRGSKDTANPYFINCCGYIKIKSTSISLIRRRVDYYLIYLVNGVGHYKIGDTYQTIQRGNIIMYKPLEEQDYYYVGNEQAELYWIHFTGNAVEELIKNLGLLDKHIYQIGIQTECIQLFQKIIHEINIKNPAYHSLCISYLIQLLSLFSRKALLQSKGERVFKNSDIESVIKKMHLEYQEDHSIGYYADSCNLSIYQFIRKFQKSMQMSPARYIEKIRVDKGKELLSDTDLTISDISSVIGFNDPFYFSKVFKKNTGLNPMAFRKMKKITL
jgi:AraC-like DNA-binding protein